MKTRLLRFALVACLFLPGMAWSQINLVSVMDIQTWPGMFQPDSCNAGPNPVYLNDTVRVRGVVMVPGGVAISSSGARWIWIRDINASASTPYCGISIRNPGATSPFDLNNTVAGDTIEVVGIVQEFHGAGTPIPNNEETQMAPIPGGVRLLSEESGPAPQPYFLSNLRELNGNLNLNNQPTNHITTGEKYEGNFVELHDLTVVSVQNDQANDRIRFLVKDAANNHIWVYDRFKTQRPSNGFIAPNVGDQFTVIKGIIESWQNGCGNSATSNRGYNINPFSLEHYTKGASSPSIGVAVRTPVCPNPTQGTSISATVTDDGSITMVEILYSTNGTNWTNVLASPSGNAYEALIPQQPEGTLVRYYVKAVDNVNNTTLQPNVPAGSTPYFYSVNSGGCTIRDIQYTPFITGRSGYEQQSVTVRGVVTASAAPTNLGYVYIQQQGQTSWGGIWVSGGASISNLAVGDLVDITGVVNEYFGLTRLVDITNVALISTGQPVPTPVTLGPAQLSTYNFNIAEQYESMLVKLEAPGGQSLFVVDTNADAANGANNGEYRIGTDLLDPNSGCRILVGRQTSSAFSSINVSYINSPLWATGLNVPAKIVNVGDPVVKAEGILTYSFNNMKLLPRNNEDMDITTGVAAKLSAKDFGVYPNPSNGSFALRFSLPVHNAQVEIYTNQGQLVTRTSVSGAEIPVNSKLLNNGLYRLRVLDADGSLLATQSLIIQK